MLAADSTNENQCWTNGAFMHAKCHAKSQYYCSGDNSNAEDGSMGLFGCGSKYIKSEKSMTLTFNSGNGNIGGLGYIFAWKVHRPVDELNLCNSNKLIHYSENQVNFNRIRASPPPRTRCTWMFTADPGKKLYLHFHQSTLLKTSERPLSNGKYVPRFCRYDYIECRDWNNKRKRIGRYCGDKAFDNDDYATVALNSNKVWCQLRLNNKGLNEHVNFYVDTNAEKKFQPEDDVPAIEEMRKD